MKYFNAVIRLCLLAVMGLFAFIFIGPHYFGDPDIRVDKSHPRHELCLKGSERKEFRKTVSPAMQNVIEGKSKDVGGVLDAERKDYVAQTNKHYGDCLADFDSLPKKCFDDFNNDYIAKGFDPEKYSDFRKDVVQKCVAKGEIEVECRQMYASARDIEFCLSKKTNNPYWDPSK